MGRQNAAARFRELGAELQDLRKWAGLTGAEVAEKTGWNVTKISRIESGQFELEEIDLIHYLGTCKVYYPDVMWIRKLCREAGYKLGYWLAPQGEHLDDSLAALIYHESTASLTIGYEPQVVPGLLQSESYARAMISRDTWRTSENIEFCVRARMERQKVLHRSTPQRFEFLVREDALRLEVGSAAIMHDQLLTLALVSGLPSVGLRVVPASTKAASMFGGAFRVLHFVEHQPIVYLEAPYAGGMFLEDPEYVANYRKLVPAVRALALDEGQSREFVATLASEYDRGSDQPDVRDRVEEKQP